MKTLLSTVAAMVAAMQLVWTTTAQGQRFAVAVVWEPAGVLRPFAAYDAGSWKRAWPEPDEAAKSLALDDVPSIWRSRGERVSRSWRLWPRSGGPAVQTQVLGVQVVDAGCFEQVALRTDLPKAQPSQPSRFGIAVDSESVTVAPIEEVQTSDASFKAAEKIVLGSFSQLERAAKAPLPVESPAPVARLTRLYRESRSPRSPMYFVAEKQYRTPADPKDAECMAATVVTGWLVPQQNGTYRLTSTQTFVTDCDRMMVRIAEPLGAMRVDNRSFWVLSESGYEDVEFHIVEIQRSDVTDRLKIDGGGC